MRGIPVVKVFQQTVYSFKAFHDAIKEYSEMAENYAVKVCAKAQVTSLTAISGVAIFLVPAILIFAPSALSGGTDAFIGFIADFAFYAIFSAVIATACTRLMFVAEEIEISADAAHRIEGILSAPILAEPEHPKAPASYDICFDDVSFRYEGAGRDALKSVSFTVPQGATVALVGPSGGARRLPHRSCRVFGMLPPAL